MCCSNQDFDSDYALIRELCAEGKIGVAMQLHSELFRKNAIPDIHTYNFLMNGLCKMGDLSTAPPEHTICLRMDHQGVGLVNEADEGRGVDWRYRAP